jgi:hypothetical protein
MTSRGRKMPKQKIQKTPKLYHGTSESIAKTACVKGLQPYEIDALDSGFPRSMSVSSLSGVCVTTTYPGLMAFNATLHKERWGIIEIDATQLEQEALLPYEGFLLEKTKGKLTSEDERLKKLSHFRHGLSSHRKKWRESLEDFGFCVYEKLIPLQAIVRVTIYDPLSNWTMTKSMLNVNVGSKFHQSNLHRQEMTSRWINGDYVATEDWIGNTYAGLSHSQKDKVTQILQNKHGLDIFYSGNVKKIPSWWG